MKKKPLQKEDAVAAVLVLLALSVGFWLLLSTWKQWQGNGHTMAVRRGYEKAKQDVELAKVGFQRSDYAFTNAMHEFNTATDEFKKAIKPGEEPWWIYLRDHAKWEAKNKAYLGAQQVLEKAVRIRKEAEQTRNEASREFRDIPGISWLSWAKGEGAFRVKTLGAA